MFFKYTGEDCRGQERNQFRGWEWLILEVRPEGLPDGLKAEGGEVGEEDEWKGRIKNESFIFGLSS